MAIEHLNAAMLFVHENTLEINKQCTQANLDCYNVALKYQAHLQQKILQNLANINTFENIHLIQSCIYHGHCKI